MRQAPVWALESRPTPYVEPANPVSRRTPRLPPYRTCCGHAKIDANGAGAALGVFTALVVARPLQVTLMPWIAAVEKKYPPVFYAMFFVVSYEFMSVFIEARFVGTAIKNLLL
jgi:hypothetical protein